MTNIGKAIAFDVDPGSLSTLQQALTSWDIEIIHGATASSLTRDWNLGVADLLILGAGDAPVETIDLCRRLRTQSARGTTPILVLVEPEYGLLVRSVLEAGATGCLVLPIHAKQVTDMLERSKECNQPGRHTLDLQPAQREDPWRDNGGQG